MDKAQVQLPRWKSHKEVYADTIVDIKLANPDDEHPCFDYAGFDVVLACNAVVCVSNEMIARHKPSIGEYLVQYDDGYISWSPAKAFEDGYVRV